MEKNYAKLTLVALALGVSIWGVDNSAIAQTDDRLDPNLPGPLSPPRGLRIRWSQPVPGYSEVILADPDGPKSSHPVQYLGWNDQGSWFRSYDDHQVYLWNLKKNSLTKIGLEVPPDALASLKNNRYAAAKNTAPPLPKPKGPEPQTPDTSRQAALFGNNGKDLSALLNAQPGHAPPGGADIGSVSGTHASVAAGVLTFTMSDGSKSKTYNVLRPAVGGNPNPTAGIAGTWLDKDDKLLFTIQPDKSVAGKVVPDALFDMLLQNSQQR